MSREFVNKCDKCGLYGPMQGRCLAGSVPENCSRCDADPMAEVHARTAQRLTLAEQDNERLRAEVERLTEAVQ
jgi:hypothetical protein